MGQTQRISRNNTKLTTGIDFRKVTLHSTDIVLVTDDHITLNSGGWRTVTTKTRMNQVSNEWNLGYGIRQTDGEWSVHIRGTGTWIPFTDGMQLKLHAGKVI